MTYKLRIKTRNFCPPLAWYYYHSSQRWSATVFAANTSEQLFMMMPDVAQHPRPIFRLLSGSQCQSPKIPFHQILSPTKEAHPWELVVVCSVSAMLPFGGLCSDKGCSFEPGTARSVSPTDLKDSSLVIHWIYTCFNGHATTYNI
jgi:hypothetical protein